MTTHRPKRNYSQDEIGKLINESQKKVDYINRIIDSDIHFNMITESNSPLKDKYKYLGNDFNINSKNHFQQNHEKIKNINLDNSSRSRYYINGNSNYTEDNKGYNINSNILSYSLNVNKPFHREKKHFPLINNSGNFFRKENQHLNRRKFINSFGYTNSDSNYQNIRKYRYNRKSDDYNREEFKSNRNYVNRHYPVRNLGRSNSMVNISNDFPKLNGVQNKFFRNNIISDENKFNKIEHFNSRNEKHYNPRRYDYENSRYGDITYNYYLNEPMRGDISSDWKFPPLYRYNS